MPPGGCGQRTRLKRPSVACDAKWDGGSAGPQCHHIGNLWNKFKRAQVLQSPGGGGKAENIPSQIANLSKLLRLLAWREVCDA